MCPPHDLHDLREKWREVPRRRPTGIVTPGPGQQSVWDYPRPPRVERVDEQVRVEFAGVVIARSGYALRVVETSSPPCYYVPRQDVLGDPLEDSASTSFCEWKGIAHYLSLRVGDQQATDAAWTYPDPDPGYQDLRDHLAFFASRVDSCYVGDALVRAQPGMYYGGWITPDVVGPFKGEPGTEDW